MRLLYLQTTPVPPSTEDAADRFLLLSSELEGDVLHPLWFSSEEEVLKHFGPDSWPLMRKGRFAYRWFLPWKYTGWRRRLMPFLTYIILARRIYKEKPFDCVMTYSHMTTALCGVVIKLLTGARLVVEVVCEPSRVYLREREHPRFVDQLRALYSDLCLHISLLMCDSVHLLYPGQIDRYPLLRQVPRAAFHEFVPINAVERHVDEEPYILLVGAPWYRKGADLLIEAYRRLSKDFPAVRLKILGHFPGRDMLHELAESCQGVELMAARPHHETLRIISNCTIFVLPSREEGMGRVLLEAMAAGVPVVGAAVGGITSLVRDGENGYLFPEEDVPALEQRLRLLLSDPELRSRMGQRGYEMAHGEFSTASYADHFFRLIRSVVQAGRSAPRS